MATAVLSSDGDSNLSLCMYYTVENCKNNRESISNKISVPLCPCYHLSYKAYQEMVLSDPESPAEFGSEHVETEVPTEPAEGNTFQQQASSSASTVSKFPFSNLSPTSPPFVPLSLNRAVATNAIVNKKCEYCNSFILHPTDQEQRNRHIVQCLGQYERKRQMDHLIQKSLDKQCTICYENVISKENPANKFGVLLNCWHVFCLECIRKWRTSRQFENEIIRACPVCRISSDFVCPSNYWVETKEEKDRLLANYRKVLSRVDCRYFKFGTGVCRFGNKCFYRHCDTNFEYIDAGAPVTRRTRRDHVRSFEHEIDQIGRLLLLEFTRGHWLDSEFDSDDSDTS